MHARRLAEQHVERQIDRGVAKVAVGQAQGLLGGRLTHHRIGGALALADGIEIGQPLGRHRQHIALLRFVTPDLQRAHPRLIVGHLAQFKEAATAAIVDQFRQGVGDTAGAHIVDKADRVGSAQLPAAVDHLLTATLHLRVVALHRGKVEIG